MNKKIKDLEAKVKDSKNLRDRELKAANDEMKKWQKKAEQSEKLWAERRQVCGILLDLKNNVLN